MLILMALIESISIRCSFVDLHESIRCSFWWLYISSGLLMLGGGGISYMSSF